MQGWEAIMRNRDLLGSWVRRFLLEHLVADRNLSRNTQVSYRDTLTLFLPFVAKRVKIAIDRLPVTDIAPDHVRAFLKHLEDERHCSIITRNQRLAAIRSLAYFIGARAPEHLAWCTEVRAIPFKKAAKRVIDYLDKPEMEALIQAPDQSTVLGRRDHAMLLFMYNSGARADEVAGLCLRNLQLGTSPSVRILGKGNKWRVCPLWPVTAAALQPLVHGRGEAEHVFLGRTGKPITRFGVHRLVTGYAIQAGKKVESMNSKRIGPHTIRHTTAVHLLRAGVDINTIRAWLGHVSLDTTNIYAEVDLEMKARALAKVDVSDLASQSSRPEKLPSLMAFMRGL
jgi:site-specific recombinase XerD